MWSVFDVTKKEQEILRIEQEAGVAGFWDDYQNAQNIMQELGKLKETVSVWRGFQRDVEATLDLVILSIEEHDNSFKQTDRCPYTVSYTHLRAHETPEHRVCRLVL